MLNKFENPCLNPKLKEANNPHKINGDKKKITSFIINFLLSNT